MFSSPGDSKRTRDGLCLKWNGQTKNNRTLGFKLLGRNIAPLYLKTENVEEIALRAVWFWTSLGGFPRTWGIFFSLGDSELTPDGLGFQWNGQRNNNWALGFECLGLNIAPLYFKTDRVAETALRALWFRPTLARFPETWWIFSSPGDSRLIPDGRGFQWNGQTKNILTLGFELLGRNIALLYFKTDRVAEFALRAS